MTAKKGIETSQEAELDRLFGVRERIRDFPGGAEVIYPIDDRWDAHVEVRPHDGSPQVTSLCVAPNPYLEEEPGHLTARTLRKINLGRTFNLLRQAAMADFGDPFGPKGRLTKRGFTGVKPARGSRPGRKGHDDRFYAWLAHLYVRAVQSGSKTPVKDVAESNEVRLTIDHVRDLLGVARRRGLLSPARRGVAEGELTDRAKELLAQLEEEGKQ